jgi:RNA polymerase sigma factor (sigma-70 family)
MYFTPSISKKKQITHITKEEERELIRRFQNEDSMEALEQLLEAHNPYVQHLAAKSYKQFNKTVEFEDLMQQARMGFIKAAKQFDLNMVTTNANSPNVGEHIRFLTYAHTRIIAQMQEAWHHAHPVHIPAHTLRAIHFNIEATNSKDEERKKLARLAMKSESYDAMLDDAKSKEGHNSSYNELRLQNAITIQDPTFEDAVKNVWSPKMQRIISRLTPTEWNIFRMKMGVDDGYHYSISEISTEFNLTPKKVDKLFKRAKRIVFKYALESFESPHK